MQSFDGDHFHFDKQTITYQSSYTHEGLLVFDEAFRQTLNHHQPLIEAIRRGECADSETLIELSLVLEAWLAELFGVKKDYEAWQKNWQRQDPLSALKQLFFKKGRRHTLPEEQIDATWSLIPEVIRKGISVEGEVYLAKYYQDHPDETADIIVWLYVIWKKGFDWGVFSLPEKRDHTTLVKHATKGDDIVGVEEKPRDGFNWTETPTTEREIYHEADYCIYCHTSDTDFCRSGFPVKKGLPEIKQDVFNEHLTGCPLDEKISEMNWLMAHGSPLAAFIMVMIDNPMVPATGHRICNECMRSCIYQKQRPVNIPKIESFILDQVLALPWGVEIYDLLCRWHPLRPTQWIMQPPQNKNVFVMGMGPAGFSLSNHLLMEGCDVFGADGLKIDAIPDDWVNQPIQNYKAIYEAGEVRQCRGFGGVSEYGITARWDKNYLKLIQIALLRRRFKLKGSIRFGGNVSVEKVWDLGFDHLTIALGAGLPRGLPIPNSLAPGMRQANDFLMALHQGAYQKITDLEVRLPALVIGSGLTAIDTATELQAYYIRQIERLRMQCQFLKSQGDYELCVSQLTPTQQAVLQTMLTHAEQAEKIKADAKTSGTKPYYGKLIQSWGGVSIVYRRSMQDSPAYRLNPEEIEQGLNEGILYKSHLTPLEATLDEDGHVSGLIVKHTDDSTQVLEAGSIYVATGAAPNVAYTFEHQGTFEKSDGFYATHMMQNGNLVKVTPGQHCKDGDIAPFTSYLKEGYTVSVVGDGQKAFHGSVVRAIASAKKAYADIFSVINVGKKSINYGEVLNWFDTKLIAIEPVLSDWQRVTICAPSVANACRPGNMLRVESSNFESTVQFPASIEGDNLVFYQKNAPDYENISVMGPSGVRFSMPKAEKANVLIDVDEKGLNASIALITALKELAHEVYVVASDEVITLLKYLFKDIVIQSQQTSVPKLGFTHVWVLGHPNRVKAIDALKQVIGVFKNDTVYTAATYGPMQCMLKGVCAQCLQWQVDPLTGRRTKAVYACSWQHQPMDLVDWDHAKSRQSWHPIVDQVNQLWFKSQRGRHIL